MATLTIHHLFPPCTLTGHSTYSHTQTLMQRPPSTSTKAQPTDSPRLAVFTAGSMKSRYTVVACTAQLPPPPPEREEWPTASRRTGHSFGGGSAAARGSRFTHLYGYERSHPPRQPCPPRQPAPEATGQSAAGESRTQAEQQPACFQPNHATSRHNHAHSLMHDNSTYRPTHHT